MASFRGFPGVGGLIGYRSNYMYMYMYIYRVYNTYVQHKKEKKSTWKTLKTENFRRASSPASSRSNCTPHSIWMEKKLYLAEGYPMEFRSNTHRQQVTKQISPRTQYPKLNHYITIKKKSFRITKPCPVIFLLDVRVLNLEYDMGTCTPACIGRGSFQRHHRGAHTRQKHRNKF